MAKTCPAAVCSHYLQIFVSIIVLSLLNQNVWKDCRLFAIFVIFDSQLMVRNGRGTPDRK